MEEEDNGLDSLMAELQESKPRTKKKKKKKAQQEEERFEVSDDPAPTNEVNGGESRTDLKPSNGEDDELGGLMAELELSKPRNKKKKKKKTAPEPSDGFALLNEVDEDIAPSSLTAETKPEMEDDELGGLLAELEVSKPKKKKKKKSKKQEESTDIAESSPSIEPSNENISAEYDVEEIPGELNESKPPSSKKKSKKKKKVQKVDENADLEDIDNLMKELEPAASTTKASLDGQAKSAEKDDDGLDDLMAELDNTKPSASQKKRNKKKKKNQKANELAEDDNLDDLMKELDAPAGGSNIPSAIEPEKNIEKPDNDIDGLMAELDTGGEGGSKMSASQKKKAKKKKKAQKEPREGDTIESSTAPAPKKGKKKESAVVRKAREQQERIAAAEEANRLRLEEEERKIAEEERKKREEEEKKEAARAKKKAAFKARKERQKAEGTYLSKAEKRKKAKADAARAQLRAQGLLPMETEKEDTGNNTSTGRSGIVYERRRRRKPNSAASSATAQSGQKNVSDQPSAVESDRDKADDSLKPAEVIDDPADALENVADNWAELPDDWVNEGDVEDERVETKKVELNDKDAAQDEKEEDTEGESSEEDEEEDDESGDDDSSESSVAQIMNKPEYEAEQRLEEIRRTREKELEAAMKARSPDHLRSPIVCIMGHVDTGKTKILDRIRRTNVQDGEAGGITQQIGATYFPIEAVKKETMKLQEGKDLNYNVPSLLIIDTPGHESFTNLRSRGSSLCDIAILVIDIMHGIEPQTRESIDLLKQRRTPFIVALNKIDRIFDWNEQPDNCPTRKTLAVQQAHCREEFHRRVRECKLALAEVGFNSELYWENDDVRRTISLVPTSAITGEGIPDLLMLLLTLPQKLLVERLMYSPILEATVLEVKMIDGLGTTIDIILTGGELREGDTIVTVGLDGPITSTVRALLTPHPMKEMRVKGQYLRHPVIKAAQGVKISAEGLEKTIAGTQIVVVRDPNNADEMAYAHEEVMADYSTVLSDVNKSGLGVYVQASTLGSLEALLAFLKDSKIPVSGINIGPVHKRDVTKASVMLERKPEYAVILAFDVKVEKEAAELAEDEGITIFTAEIIYHLFDQFTEHIDNWEKKLREKALDEVVFPSVSQIIPSAIFNKKDPIIMGVEVKEGILRVNTPLMVQKGTTWFEIGKIVDIRNVKEVSIKQARKGEEVCLRIGGKNEGTIMYGRHFTADDKLVSKMSRKSIDLLKLHFKDVMENADWQLVIKMKKWFNIE